MKVLIEAIYFMDFRVWLEAEREIYYHVTYLKNLTSIGRRGLLKNLRPNFSGPLALHSQRGLFLAKENVPYWVTTLENWAEHNSDHIVKDGLIPIILRVRAIPRLTGPDEYPGNPSGSLIYPKNIRPHNLEMWNGEQWTADISSRSINIRLFVARGYFKERYPFPPEIR